MVNISFKSHTLSIKVAHTRILLHVTTHIIVLLVSTLQKGFAVEILSEL
jgi:hypothetical protein